MNRHKLLVVASILLLGVALAMLSACGPTPNPTPTTTPTPPPTPSAPPLMELGVNSLNDPRQINGNVSEATVICHLPFAICKE